MYIRKLILTILFAFLCSGLYSQDKVVVTKGTTAYIPTEHRWELGTPVYKLDKGDEIFTTGPFIGRSGGKWTEVNIEGTVCRVLSKRLKAAKTPKTLTDWTISLAAWLNVLALIVLGVGLSNSDSDDDSVGRVCRYLHLLLMFIIGVAMCNCLIVEEEAYSTLLHSSNGFWDGVKKYLGAAAMAIMQVINFAGCLAVCQKIFKHNYTVIISIVASIVAFVVMLLLNIFNFREYLDWVVYAYLAVLGIEALVVLWRCNTLIGGVIFYIIYLSALLSTLLFVGYFLLISLFLILVVICCLIAGLVVLCIFNAHDVVAVVRDSSGRVYKVIRYWFTI